MDKKKKCKKCIFWMDKDGFCCIMDKIMKYCLKNGLLYWESRIAEVETKIEHHADMIYNKLQKKDDK